MNLETNPNSILFDKLSVQENLDEFETDLVQAFITVLGPYLLLTTQNLVQN